MRQKWPAAHVLWEAGGLFWISVGGRCFRGAGLGCAVGRPVLFYATCTVGMVLPKSEASQADCDHRNINLSLGRGKHALVSLKLYRR